MSKPTPWIGIDFDGVLAHYDGWKGVEHLGAPIPVMIARVQQLIARGLKVKVFTARITEGEESDALIREWTLTHIGTELEVTNIKDHGMLEMYDDRAIAIEKNTGRILGGVSRYPEMRADPELSKLKELCAASEPIVSVICPTLGARLRDALKQDS